MIYIYIYIYNIYGVLTIHLLDKEKDSIFTAIITRNEKKIVRYI